ncbi:hypothetical protein HHK36_012879 [Tetracentron sinense]|uniref:DUF4220 domain-containing protein n=1 Tax=Tetracentron sinense TaxID=13715 RepID=A0A835DEY4_TETSI|nr:hypothetical protein HHK36_012879 [Tetracentron sinense]
MENFLERVHELWNEWELRVMVLFSLYLQIILIFFGKWRKYTTQKWVRIILWLAYLSADSVAIFSLGILAKSQGSTDSSKRNGDVLIALWAPFLILHLGGPDTITAYSLEDNELWLRHLLGVVVQVGVAFYVFLRSWSSGNRLSYLGIPMFVPGIIKYGERTWVLRSASSKRFRESMFPLPEPGPDYVELMKTYNQERAKKHLVLQIKTVNEADKKVALVKLETVMVMPELSRLAYDFFKTFKLLFADLILSFENVGHSRTFFQETSCKQAFKVVNMELGFMYDVLYTKASLVYTRAGCILRAISLSSTISLFVVFLIIEKHGGDSIPSSSSSPSLSSSDIVITHILFAGAIVLEIYAVLVLLSSNWAMAWYSKHKHTNMKNKWNLIFGVIFSSPLTSNERWSNTMAQFNLLSYCLKDQASSNLHGLIHKYLYHHINEMNLYTTFEKVSRGLKEVIFQHLKEKSTMVKTFQDCKMVCSLRGDGVFGNKDSLKNLLAWSVNEVEFDQSILLWHIATDLCYNSETHHLQILSEMSKSLSAYMLYLLVVCPFMLPNGIGQIRFQDTCAEAMRFLKQDDYFILDKTQACTKLLDVNTEIAPKDVKGDRSKSVLFDGCRLAKILGSLPRDEIWEVTTHVWVEMLSYAANKCGGYNHAKQLGRGGELLTHVWLLMAQLGITEQFQITQGNVDATVASFF